MKFTETRFKFPIKIYDGFELEKKLKLEETENIEPQEADWIMGWARVSPNDIENATWYDYFSRGMKIEDVDKNGFDLTLVDTPSKIYLCLWQRDKFEEELNKFWEKYKAFEEQKIDNALAKAFGKDIEP